ncbi:hypothetical protein BELL_0128g00190 [Botrytis elliptica]|uniref:Uncharacterized protein n=1 Tax=Botrytis elliptica TaxID=278938 RepID=A0A4Z1K0C1_9HELO|nr:hypothetical protein BELL_0128g00190 [Botrytis elliptica]
MAVNTGARPIVDLINGDCANYRQSPVPGDGYPPVILASEQLTFPGRNDNNDNPKGMNLPRTILASWSSESSTICDLKL